MNRLVAGTLGALVMMTTSNAAEGQKAAAPSRVVFVCEHGTVKSVLAVQYFNRLAKTRGLDVLAVSRGTHPDAAIPAPVLRGLTADGFDMAGFQPRLFAAPDLESTQLVVVFDADPKDITSVVANRAAVTRWDGLPAVSEGYGNGRDAIVARVEKLVDSLVQSRSKKP